MTIEALSAEQQYSPFQMLASGLAYCTYSVMVAWATHAGLSADDLAIEVRWTFADDPHRMDSIQLDFEWPSLPAKRYQAARRVAEMCTIHATLHHPPTITIGPINESNVASQGVAEHQGAA
jgi:putative redox protein